VIPSWKNTGLMVLFSFLFIVLAGAAKAQDSSPASNQSLHFVSWKGNFLSWQKKGIACWIHDDAGNLRFEVMVGGQQPFPENLNRILDWNAYEGWTVISVESGGGTFSRWNEEWLELSPALDTWLRVVVSQTSGGVGLPASVRDISPDGRSLTLPFFENGKERIRVKRLQLPKLQQNPGKVNHKNPGFRRLMVGRGHGRGGHETVLNLIGNTNDVEGIRITSSHQPGSLHLSQLRSISADFNHEEVFLPWWPLSGILHLKL
jgi:hypothetical protein